MREYIGKDFPADSFERHVLENGLGKPQTLDAAPTTAGNQLPKHGDSGWFGTDLFINLNGNIYSIQLTLT